MARFRDTLLRLLGSSSGETILKSAATASGTLTLPAGTTDFSATGGASQVVKQTSAGGALTVGQLATTDLSDTTAWTSYTPVATANSGTFTSVTPIGRWTKQGNIVSAQVSISITTNGTASGFVIVTLPVPVGAGAVVLAGNGRAGVVSGKQLVAIAFSSTQAAILNYDGTYPGSNGEILAVFFQYEG